MLHPSKAVLKTQERTDAARRVNHANGGSVGSPVLGLDWRRLRVQLGGCLLVALLIPFLIATQIFDDRAYDLLMFRSLAGCIAAICLGTWLLRSLSTYPGIEASSHILPAFIFAFGAVLLLFFLGRFGYNRFILLSSFTCSIVWYNFVNIMIGRGRPLRVGLVPFGAVDGLADVPRIIWVSLDQNRTEQVDAIVADLRSDLPADWDRFLADCALEGVPVYHTKSLMESLTGRVELEHLSESSFGSLAPLGAYMTVKHILDWLAALATLIVLAPVLLVIGLLIRLDSKGPAIFRQRRIGYRGRPFTVFKFRTMRAAPEAQHDEFRAAMTRDADSRVTRIGQFLRRTRLDELPQLVNVLRGEMSIIGPRPEAEILSRWYETGIPFYRYRHIVRPGITGWAQVNQGHVAELDEVRTKLHFDFYYIKNFSPWLDLLIVARTIRTVLTGFGAR